MSRDELIVVVHRQAERIAAQDQQISAQAGQIAQLMEANETLTVRLARLEHLISRNSGNSSMPPSKDDDPGKPAPPEPTRRGGGKRSRGKQPGAPGSHLAWTTIPDDRQDRFPQGSCGCGADLGGARDLGVADRYQSHDIPQVSVTVVQFDQHQVQCGCGAVHTATRPAGARAGLVGYGPNLQAFVVYLLIVQFLPVARVVALLESLTGATPSVGFVHGMLARTAGLLAQVHDRIRTLITLAYAVCCDETPLRVGPRTPKPGKKKAERYLLVFCTEFYTHYLLGDRSLATFKDSLLTDLGARPDGSAIIVHDRYINYDSTELGALAHQLCAAHLLRDLDSAAQVYPDAVWPVQIAAALRGLIHEANLARDHSLDTIPDDVRDALRDAPIAGHNDARSARGPTGPGSRRAGPLRGCQGWRSLVRTLSDDAASRSAARSANPARPNAITASRDMVSCASASAASRRRRASSRARLRSSLTLHSGLRPWPCGARCPRLCRLPGSAAARPARATGASSRHARSCP